MEENRQNNYIIPLSIIIAGALVSLAIYFGGSSSGTQALAGQAVREKLSVTALTEDEHILGSREAEIIIVEYSDTECPFCKTFHSTMKDIVREYDGKVAWVYRHFPIAQLHARAMKEAEATECAAELGGNQAFWNYIDEVFERTNSNDSLNPSELPVIAGDIGLNVEAFNQCLSSGKYAEFIKKSVEDAVKSGARGTPYSVILHNGKEALSINGAEPIEMVRTKIDSLL